MPCPLINDHVPVAGTVGALPASEVEGVVEQMFWSGPALAEQGVWMAMKGKHPADEMAALPASVKVFLVEQLQVPGLGAERCIVWMRKAG